MMLLPRSLKRAAAILALCAFAYVAAAAAAGASSSEKNEAAAATFAAAAPASAAAATFAAAAPASAAAATFAAAAPTSAAAAAAAASAAAPFEFAAEAPSPSSSLEALDATSAAIADAAAAVDTATLDALLRIRAAVSPSSSDKKGEAAGPDVAADADAAADAAPGPLSAPSSSAAAAEVSASSSTLARESQDAYRSYKGLVPGSRFAQLAPLAAFPGSPPARAESAAALAGRATLTPPGEATTALAASLPPPGAAPAPSSYSRGRGKRYPPPPAPSPSSGNGNPRGDGTDSKRLWKLTIDAAATRQPFEGFGTSLAWWALVVGSFAESVRNKVADLIFDASKGLGLEVVRYNIGGSGWDCPGKSDMRPGGAVPSFLSPDWKTYDWSLDAGQRWTLLAARDRGASVFEAFSNSPPCFMTSSGYASGNWDANNDNLPSKNYEAFASYLAEVVNFYREEHNITFRTLDAFNEPMTNYWYAGNAQEGCHFDRSSQSAFLPVMRSALVKKGLENTVELSASDETCIASAEESLRAWTPEALSAVSQVNTHTYWGPSYPRAKLAENAQKLGKRLWQSEYGAGAAPPWEMPDALSMGTQIAADLNVMGARAWVYWQAVENLDGKPPTPWWGLAQLSFGNGGSGLRTGKQFWALAQFSRSIRRGATVLASPRAADTVVALQPRKDGKGRDLVIVMTNVDREEAAASVDVSSFLNSSPSSSSATAAAATVKAWRTSSSEDRADAGDIALSDSWGGKFDVRLAPESLTTLVVSLSE